MTTKQLSKQIFIIAVPIIIQMFAEYVLTFTDTAFIGHYTPAGLSAITNSIIPYFMFLSFFFALSKGTTVLIAQNIGARKFKVASRYAEVSFFFNQLISFGYFVFWILFADKIISIIGAKGEVYTMSVSYVRILSYNFLFFGIMMTSRSIFEGEGNTIYILIASTIRVGLNILLDWIMIFGKFGIPEMGIKGAAIATVISQFVGMIILTFFVFTKTKDFKISLKGILRVRLNIYSKVAKLGIPAGLEFMAWTMGQTIILLFLNKIDGDAAGIFGIINLLMNFSVYIYLGIAVAALTLVGKSHGARQWDHALKASHISLIYALIVCTMISLVFFIFPKQITMLFTQDKGVMNKAYILIYLAAIVIFPKSINIVAGNSIRGTGNTVWMLLTQLPGTVLLIIFVYFLIFTFKLGLVGLIFALFIDELWRAIANYFKFRQIIARNSK